jgi:hypothetical protein
VPESIINIYISRWAQLADLPAKSLGLFHDDGFQFQHARPREEWVKHAATLFMQVGIIFCENRMGCQETVVECLVFQER